MSDVVAAEPDEATGLLWMVLAKNRAPLAPPYEADMVVTPESVYWENSWSFPKTWLALNVRDRRTLNFCSPCVLTTGRYRLLPGRDDRLIEQLKQVMWSAFHERAMLSIDGRKKTRGLKPAGAYAALSSYRRIFVGLAASGCRSLDEVDAAMLTEAFQRLQPSSSMFELLAMAFQDIKVFSDAGLITNGLRFSAFEYVVNTEVTDLSGPSGIQPIGDDEVASLIKSSLEYVRKANDIIAVIEGLLKNSDPIKTLLWAQNNLPCGNLITSLYSGKVRLISIMVRLLHVACGNLISFHSGFRVSELLSIKTGFVIRGHDQYFDMERLVMHVTTYKTVQSFKGSQRELTAHPLILEVCEVLTRLKAVLGTDGEHLFVPFQADEPYLTNSWNYALQSFCDLNGVAISISSHRWRKTVAGIAIRVLTGGTMHLKELFGHRGLAMTSRYILASPFIREEIRDLTLDAYRKRGEALFTSLAAVGGPGLGGIQGKHLEARFSTLVSSDVTQSDLRKTLDGFVEEMVRQEVYPIPVMPGVLCTKPRRAVGVCAGTSGDRMADPARCSSACTFQVQEANRLPVARWTVSRMVKEWESWSPLQQRYWLSECADLMKAWPELKQEMKIEIALWPALLSMIEASDG